MLITKKYIFHYDTKQAASKHTKYLAHDGQECTGYFLGDEEPTTFDVVHVVFEDKFSANVYAYELEEIK